MSRSERHDLTGEDRQERRDLMGQLELLLASLRVHNRPYSQSSFEMFQATKRMTLFDTNDERAVRRVIDLLRADVGMPAAHESIWQETGEPAVRKIK